MNLLLLLVIVIVLFGFGGGYYGYSSRLLWPRRVRWHRADRGDPAAGAAVRGIWRGDTVSPERPAMSERERLIIERDGHQVTLTLNLPTLYAAIETYERLLAGARDGFVTLDVETIRAEKAD